MNLQELNGGTVVEKDWLNPVCGTITCDTIIASNLPASFNQALNTFDAVQFAGITSTANIDAGSSFVLSTGVPSINSHLTNKLYVDTGLNGKLSLSGGTMTGNITTLRTNDTKIGLGNGVVVPTFSVDTIQIGANAGRITIGSNSICIGKSCCNTASTVGADSITLGREAGNPFDIGIGAITIGKLASGAGNSSICLGEDSITIANSGIAIGKSAISTASNSIAFGEASTSNNANSMVFNANGSTAGQTTASNQIAFIAGTTNFRYDATGFNITNATSSTSTTTGSLRCAGGLGVVENLNVGGTFTCPMPIGGLFMESNATTTTVSATPGNFVKILGTTTASTQNVSFTHTNNRLTYSGLKTTIFAVSYCLTINPSTSTDIEWEVGLSFNGSATPQLMGRTHIHSITNGHRYSCSGVLIITLATSQFVELFLANKTNNTTNCIVEDMSIVMNPYTN